MKQKIMKVLLTGAIICGYKVLYAPDELKKEGKEGQIQWVEGVRGWDENGTYLWTGVSPLPSYNVGIGTSTPGHKLDVVGSARIRQGDLYINSWPISVTSAPTIGHVLKWNGSAFVPQPDAGVDVYTVRLTSLVTTTSLHPNWVDIPGMQITLTPKDDKIYIFVSATARHTSDGYYAQFGQSGFLIRVVNVNTGQPVAYSGAVITDFDEDYYGGWWLVTTGNAAINGQLVYVTPGQQVTFKLQWCCILSWTYSPWCVAINPNIDIGDHCIFTIVD